MGSRLYIVNHEALRWQANAVSAEKEVQFEVLTPCKVYRPFILKNPQIVVYKVQLNQAFYEIAVGLVVAVFRSARKRKGNSGHADSAVAKGGCKPMCTDLFAHASARLRVARLQRNEKCGEWITHALSPMHILDPVELVLAEVPGVQSKEVGAIFSLRLFPEQDAAIRKLQQGEIQVSSVTSRESPDAEHEAPAGPAPQACLTERNFSRSGAGLKLIEEFMLSLPKKYHEGHCLQGKHCKISLTVIFQQFTVFPEDRVAL